MTSRKKSPKRGNPKNVVDALVLLGKMGFDLSDKTAAVSKTEVHGLTNLDELYQKVQIARHHTETALSNLNRLGHAISVEDSVGRRMKERYYVYVCERYGKVVPTTISSVFMSEALTEGPFHDLESARNRCMMKNHNSIQPAPWKKGDPVLFGVIGYEPESESFRDYGRTMPPQGWVAPGVKPPEHWYAVFDKDNLIGFCLNPHHTRNSEPKVAFRLVSRAEREKLMGSIDRALLAAVLARKPEGPPPVEDTSPKCVHVWCECSGQR